jgi:hypothetical protein
MQLILRTIKIYSMFLLLLCISCTPKNKVKAIAKKHFEKNIVENLKDPSSYKLIEIEVIEITKQSMVLNFLNALAADTIIKPDDTLLLQEDRVEYSKTLKSNSYVDGYQDLIKQRIKEGELFAKYLIEKKAASKHKIDSTLQIFNDTKSSTGQEIDHYVAKISYYANNSYGARLKSNCELIIYTDPEQVIDLKNSK